MNQNITVDGTIYNVIDELPEAGYNPINGARVLDIRRAYPERTNRVENELITYELYEIICEIDDDNRFVALRRYYCDVQKDLLRGQKFGDAYPDNENMIELLGFDCFDEKTGKPMKKSGNCIFKFPCGLEVRAYCDSDDGIGFDNDEIIYDPEFREGDPRRTQKYPDELKGRKWEDLMTYQRDFILDSGFICDKSDKERTKDDETPHIGCSERKEDCIINFNCGLSIEGSVDQFGHRSVKEGAVLYDSEEGLIEPGIENLIDQIPNVTIFAKLHKDEDLYAVVSGYGNIICHQPEYDLHEIDETVISDAIEEFRRKGDNDYFIEIYKVNSQIYRLNDDGEVRDDEWMDYENIVYSSRPESYVNRIWEEARDTDIFELIGKGKFEDAETELDCILTGYEDDMPGLDQLCKFRLFDDVPESLKLLAQRIETLINILSFVTDLKSQADVAEIRAKAVKSQRLIQIMIGLRIDD